jgi:hypothetical protein
MSEGRNWALSGVILELFVDGAANYGIQQLWSPQTVDALKQSVDSLRRVFAIRNRRDGARDCLTDIAAAASLGLRGKRVAWRGLEGWPE